MLDSSISVMTSHMCRGNGAHAVPIYLKVQQGGINSQSLDTLPIYYPTTMDFPQSVAVAWLQDHDAVFHSYLTESVSVPVPYQHRDSASILLSVPPGHIRSSSSSISSATHGIWFEEILIIAHFLLDLGDHVSNWSHDEAS